MKCIIAGTRTITDYELVAQAIADSGWQDEITEVVCGASEGQVEFAQEAFAAGVPSGIFKFNVDILGALLAIANGIPVKHFPPDWNTYGKPAGPIRNEQMAKYANALILIWDGKSKGSASMKRLAKQHGLRIYEQVVVI